ncbi:hypothetical protein KGF54_003483 [Candida jiufengensis]|uniref:uncharacterized protein n=1 Tax=Candida jiufengensis TaxID=497108 RepID=UPI0022249C34|nr:uncharacterized protein KGF54_003483 [Candida jiufengensis]KAI5952616.1 hypothetical protein KGF54_003483 [Candida jiufengensis]
MTTATTNLPSVKTTLVEVTDKLSNPPCRIFFKNEYLQPSGSFKLRGIGYMLQKKIEEAKKLGKSKVIVFSSSGGNAGLAAAYAAKYYNVECTVVLPKTSTDIVIEKLKKLGANVIVHGDHWGEADKYLTEVVMKSINEDELPVYCHPFEHELIWKGHSKIIDEIIEEGQLPNLNNVKGIVCSAGGGGLYNGIVEGLKNQKQDIPVLVIETEQAPTFHETVKQDKSITLSSIKTLASSLGSPYLSPKAFENYKNHPTKLGLIDDLDALKGSIDLYDKFGIITEPACGASVSTIFDKQELLIENFKNLQKDDIIIIIVCGGSSANEETLEFYRKLIKDSK